MNWLRVIYFLFLFCLVYGICNFIQYGSPIENSSWTYILLDQELPRICDLASRIMNCRRLFTQKVFFAQNTSYIFLTLIFSHGFRATFFIVHNHIARRMVRYTKCIQVKVHTPESLVQRKHIYIYIYLQLTHNQKNTCYYIFNL